VRCGNASFVLARPWWSGRRGSKVITAPRFGWINAFTVASEIGDIERFASPAKLCGYTGLCPRVIQSGATDRRGPISKHGPRYLCWGLFEAAMNACKHPLYKERYQHTKRRLGRQRGPKVAQIELSRRLTEAIWHMLTPKPTLRSGRRRFSSSRLTAPFGHAPPERASHSAQSPRRWGDRDMSAAHHHHSARGP
jgi:Transposase IS116/IS110/IS902 family